VTISEPSEGVPPTSREVEPSPGPSPAQRAFEDRYTVEELLRGTEPDRWYFGDHPIFGKFERIGQPDRGGDQAWRHPDLPDGVHVISHRDGSATLLPILNDILDVESAERMSPFELYVISFFGEPDRLATAERQIAGWGWDQEDLFADWRFQDLSILRDDEPLPEPDVGFLPGSDKALFYRGRYSGVFGNPLAGKSWLMALVAREEIRAGHHVVWVEFEDDDAPTMVVRLGAVGLRRDQIISLFHYVSPASGFSYEAEAKLKRQLGRLDVSLVVIDSLGEALGIERLNENEDGDVIQLIGAWKAFGRSINAAVVSIDHVTKSDRTSLYPSGTKRKLAGITGAMYRLDGVEPFSTDRSGHSTLVCSKDRHGKYFKGQTVATLQITHVREVTMFSLLAGSPVPEAASGPKGPDADLVKKVVEVVHRAKQPLGITAVRDRLREGGAKVSNEGSKEAVDAAVRLGCLEYRSGSGRSRPLTYVKPFGPDEEARLASGDWPEGGEEHDPGGTEAATPQDDATNDEVPVVPDGPERDGDG